MRKAKGKDNKGVALFSSMKTKTLMLVIVGILIALIMSIVSTVPMVRQSITDLTQNYMVDMASLAGMDIDRDIADEGVENALTYENLDVIIGGLGIEGMSSSYAYAVDGVGTMLYHPTPDKVGQPVENAAVKQLVAEIGKGIRPETDVIEYEFKGVMKYASFYVGKNMEYIVVVTADEDEAMSAVSEVVENAAISGLFALIVCGIVCVIVATIILTPLKKLTSIVGKMAELDFTEDELHKAVSRRKDETGLMSRAIDSLRVELVDIVGHIRNQSLELHEASKIMKQSSDEVSVSVEQVEKAVSEVAQGATSQAQETQVATENVITMGNMIEETNAEVENLRVNARAMNQAGEKAMGILGELNAVNQRTKEAIQVIAKQTNTTNESAIKIKEATDMITDIAEETNLLSLNASIEAARAGEQGRGFAVVAAQIQKLAEQSNESARQIADIINLLISDSEKTVATMEEVKDVIEQQNENVANTENAFKDVKTGIDKSIDGIRTIANKTQKLDEARIKVVDIVQSLTAIAEENAASTQETSASAEEVGAVMVTIAEDASNLNSIADDLESSIRRFTI